MTECIASVPVSLMVLAVKSSAGDPAWEYRLTAIHGQTSRFTLILEKHTHDIVCKTRRYNAALAIGLGGVITWTANR
jgi:hypothetical protein